MWLGKGGGESNLFGAPSDPTTLNTPDSENTPDADSVTLIDRDDVANPPLNESAIGK